MTIRKLKQMTKENFLKYPDATESIYLALQNSKEGQIEIWKEDKSVHEQGHTDAFGEGISCYLYTIDKWYITSVIRKINWDEKYFDTMNSRYYFNFKEYDSEGENSNSTESSDAN